MSPQFLADSTIVIDQLNRVPAAKQFLWENSRILCLSVISRAEILAGVLPDFVHDTRLLLDQYPTLSVDKEIADLAGMLRAKERWKLPDAFQAALAIHHGLRLVTRNTRDFPPAKYSFVYVPYTLP